MAWCRPEVFRAHLSWQEGKGEAESLSLTSVMSWMFAHQSDGALALLVWGLRSPVPAKGCAQAFVDSTDQSVAASSCRRPTRPSSRLQDRRVARLSQVDSYCQAAPAGGPAAGRCPGRRLRGTRRRPQQGQFERWPFPCWRSRATGAGKTGRQRGRTMVVTAGMAPDLVAVLCQSHR